MVLLKVFKLNGDLTRLTRAAVDTEQMDDCCANQRAARHIFEPETPYDALLSPVSCTHLPIALLLP